MEWAEAGQLQLLVSPLHFVEVLGQRLSGPIDLDVDERVIGLLTSNHILLVEFDLSVGMKARELRLGGVVKTVADSVHLAHAVVARADVLFTVDKDDYPLDTVVEGVHVSRPYLVGDPDLFTDEG